MFIPYHDDNALRRFPVVTVVLIAVNVLSYLLFVACQLTDPQDARLAAIELGFVPRRLTNLADGQPVRIDLYPEFSSEEWVAQDQPADGAEPVALQLPPPEERYVDLKPSILGVGVSLITCMFMHAGPWHLGFNMLFLWVFGNNIEDRLGRIFFALYYLAGGVVATLCHWAMTTPPMDALPMVGASGAVAVMLGAYAVTYPKAKIRILFLLACIPLFFELPALLVLGGWLAMELFHAWQEQRGLVTDVALWAHIGGFFFGAVTMPFLPALPPPPKTEFPTSPIDGAGIHFDDRYERRPPPVPDPRGIRWDDGK